MSHTIVPIIDEETGYSLEDTEEPHTCPFSEDVYGDTEKLCHCSEYQQYQCAMDI